MISETVKIFLLFVIVGVTTSLFTQTYIVPFFQNDGTPIKETIDKPLTDGAIIKFSHFGPFFPRTIFYEKELSKNGSLIAVKPPFLGGLAAVQVTPGYQLTIYEKKCFYNYESRSQVFTESGTANFRFRCFRLSKYSNFATVHTNADYSGDSTLLYNGEYDICDLRQRGIPNDSISSIKLHGDATAIVFRDPHFKGYDKHFFASISDLSKYDQRNKPEFNLNDKISSIKISTSEYPLHRGVSVFEHADFTGTKATFDVGIYYTNSLLANEIKKHSISSVIVRPGYQVILHGFGESHVILENNAYLENFNDKTTWLEVKSETDFVVGFAKNHFKGSSQILSSTPKSKEVFDIKSLKTFGNAIAKIYSEEKYGGFKQTINKDKFYFDYHVKSYSIDHIDVPIKTIEPISSKEQKSTSTEEQKSTSTEEQKSSSTEEQKSSSTEEQISFTINTDGSIEVKLSLNDFKNKHTMEKVLNLAKHM